ncbi:DgyrCDS1719 [Dimorphilus gyrociliatus]|uniref:BAG family molecular chaperone regulator 1 n=1 Tax=Dimorphilus gyrociliatus TaxID=2664684 RepID=A0A7I8VA99_9ANNE|nr:DgyrCDS1719 [Dimorphilus gyrociliatus]
MASKDAELLDMIVKHGFHKHSIRVPKQISGQQVAVKDLELEIQNCIKVPVGRQKIIFKGRFLKESEKSLASYGIGNGSIIMVIGDKFDPESDENMKIMAGIEQKIKDIEKSYSEMEATFTHLKDDLSVSTNAKDSQGDIKDLQKKTAFIIENLSKQLESLDSLVLSDELTIVKQKRRTIVKEIQRILNKCDSLDEEFVNFCK